MNELATTAGHDDRATQPTAGTVPPPETAAGPHRSSAARQVCLLAWKEANDRYRSGWVLISAVVWLGAIGLTSVFGQIQIGRIGIQGYERTAISLLNLAQYFVPLLGLLLGHDLIVGERESGTLALLVASGVPRQRLMLGKYVGAVVTLGFPLVLGFVIAGAAIGGASSAAGSAVFVRLGISAVLLGGVFVAIGLWISTVCATRVRALVVALLTWCAAVFVFDLVAMGILLSSRATSAATEIEAVCEVTGQHPIEDIHSAYNTPEVPPKAGSMASPRDGLGWVLLNPIDLFRAVNLPELAGRTPSAALALGVFGAWIAASLGVSIRSFQRCDL